MAPKLIEISSLNKDLSRDLKKGVFLEGAQDNSYATDGDFLDSFFSNQQVLNRINAAKPRTFPNRSFFKSPRISDEIKWQIAAYYGYAPNDAELPTQIITALSRETNEITIQDLQSFINEKQISTIYANEIDALKRLRHNSSFTPILGAFDDLRTRLRGSFLGESAFVYDSELRPTPSASTEFVEISQDKIIINQNWCLPESLAIISSGWDPFYFENIPFLKTGVFSLQYEVDLQKDSATPQLVKVIFSDSSPQFIAAMQILLFCKDLYIKPPTDLQEAGFLMSTDEKKIGQELAFAELKGKLANSEAFLDAFIKAKIKVKQCYNISDEDEPDFTDNKIRNAIIALTEFQLVDQKIDTHLEPLKKIINIDLFRNSYKALIDYLIEHNPNLLIHITADINNLLEVMTDPKQEQNRVALFTRLQGYFDPSNRDRRGFYLFQTAINIHLPPILKMQEASHKLAILADEPAFRDSEENKKAFTNCYIVATQKAVQEVFETPPFGSLDKKILIKEAFALFLENQNATITSAAIMKRLCKQKLDALKIIIDKINFDTELGNKKTKEYTKLAAAELHQYLQQLLEQEKATAKDFALIYECCTDTTPFFDNFTSIPKNEEEVKALHQKVCKEGFQLANKYMPAFSSNQGHVSLVAGRVIFIALAAVLIATAMTVLAIYCPPLLLGIAGLAMKGTICAGGGMLAAGFSALLAEGVSQTYRLFLNAPQQHINKIRFGARDDMKKLEGEVKKNQLIDKKKLSDNGSHGRSGSNSDSTIHRPVSAPEETPSLLITSEEVKPRRTKSFSGTSSADSGYESEGSPTKNRGRSQTFAAFQSS
jgi:hypothetical protein